MFASVARPILNFGWPSKESFASANLPNSNQAVSTLQLQTAWERWAFNQSMTLRQQQQHQDQHQRQPHLFQMAGHNPFASQRLLDLMEFKHGEDQEPSTPHVSDPRRGFDSVKDEPDCWIPNQAAKYYPFGNNVDPATLRPQPLVPFHGLSHPGSMGAQAHMSNLNYNLKPESGHAGYWPTHSNALPNFAQFPNQEELMKWHDIVQGPQVGGELDGLPSMSSFSTNIAGSGQMIAEDPFTNPMSATFSNPEYTIPGTTASFSSADSPDTLDSAVFTDDGRVSPYSSSSQQLTTTGYLFSPVSRPDGQQGRHPSIPAISLTMATSPTTVNPVWRQPSPGMATSTDSLPNTVTMGSVQGSSYLTAGNIDRGAANTNEPPQMIAPKPRKPLPSRPTNLMGRDATLKKDKRARDSRSRSPPTGSRHSAAVSKPPAKVPKKLHKRPPSLPSTPLQSLNIQPLGQPPSSMSSSATSTHQSETPQKTAAEIAERERKDRYLLWGKDTAGMTYSQIKERGGFTEAESTLRGRYRMLNKAPEERIRKPKWTEVDLRLLEKGVRLLAVNPRPPTGTRAPRSRRTTASTSTSRTATPTAATAGSTNLFLNPTGNFTTQLGHSQTTPALAYLTDTDNLKIPWKQVSDYIYNNGGTYHFGNSTCRKRWDALVEEHCKGLGKDIRVPFFDGLGLGLPAGDSSESVGGSGNGNGFLDEEEEEDEDEYYF